MSVILDHTGLWIVPDRWKTRRRVSHRSLDGAQNAPPTTLHRPLSSTRMIKSYNDGFNARKPLHVLTTASRRSEK